MNRYVIYNYAACEKIYYQTKWFWISIVLFWLGKWGCGQSLCYSNYHKTFVWMCHLQGLILSYFSQRIDFFVLYVKATIDRWLLNQYIGPNPSLEMKPLVDVPLSKSSIRSKYENPFMTFAINDSEVNSSFKVAKYMFNNF